MELVHQPCFIANGGVIAVDRYQIHGCDVGFGSTCRGRGVGRAVVPPSNHEWAMAVPPARGMPRGGTRFQFVQAELAGPPAELRVRVTSADRGERSCPLRR
jgi:hypothetical protein